MATPKDLENAYRRFRFDNDGRWPRRTYTYYCNAKSWLKEQGCDIDLLKEDCSPGWESESKKLEFILRWI